MGTKTRVSIGVTMGFNTLILSIFISVKKKLFKQDYKNLVNLNYMKHMEIEIKAGLENWVVQACRNFGYPNIFLMQNQGYIVFLV